MFNIHIFLCLIKQSGTNYSTDKVFFLKVLNFFSFQILFIGLAYFCILFYYVCRVPVGCTCIFPSSDIVDKFRSFKAIGVILVAQFLCHIILYLQRKHKLVFLLHSDVDQVSNGIIQLALVL